MKLSDIEVFGTCNSKCRAVWDKGVRHEVQICVYCRGSGNIVLMYALSAMKKERST